MYIVNDIEHLINLVKLKMLDLSSEMFVTSRLKRFDYGHRTLRQLDTYHQIKQLHIDELDLFEHWRAGRSRQLTDGDLSTIYIAMKNPKLTILLSKEDLFIPTVCDQCSVRYRKWDEVIKEIGNKERIQYYEYI